MIWALILQVVLTFDPYSVKTIEYRPQDAIQLSDGRTAYRQVLLTFDKMIVLKPGESSVEKASTSAPVMHPDAEQGRFAYQPRDCKPLHDPKQHYVCVDPYWGKQAPRIYFTATIKK